jgi:hypothetical protein
MCQNTLTSHHSGSGRSDRSSRVNTMMIADTKEYQVDTYVVIQKREAIIVLSNPKSI